MTDLIALAHEHCRAVVHYEGHQDGYEFTPDGLAAFAARIAKAPEDERTQFLQMIVALSAGWDEHGSLGPKPPYSWETVGRMAMDYANAALATSPVEPPEDERAAFNKATPAGCYTLEALDFAWFMWQARASLPPAHQAGGEGWISVDERLPEHGAEVMALIWPFDNHQNKQRPFHAVFVDDKFFTEDGEDLHPPSHWLPLPPAPSALALKAHEQEGPTSGASGL